MNTRVFLPSPVANHGSHWHACLQLRFRHGPRGSRLVESRHEGPLYVQRPFYPEGLDLAHAYLLHPPGGLVSGDRLRIELHLEEDSQVLCTTPGAGRLYRARSDRRLQEQQVSLKAERGASLEWFPQETIVFPGAHASLDTRVELGEAARFAGWDIAVFGLPANGLDFSTGHLRQRLRIDVAGRPVLIENLVLDAERPALQRSTLGLHAQPVSGLFVCGPFTPLQFDETLMASLQETAKAFAPFCAITRLGSFLVGRFLGDCAQKARACFIAWWRLLRPVLLQRQVCLPAIWST